MDVKDGKVLVVDDDADVLLAAELFLKRHVAELRTEADPERLPELLESESFDVIFLDMNFTRDMTSGEEGFSWLARILEIDPSAVVILITAFAELDLAVRAVKAGAADFIEKPWKNQKLLASVAAAMALRSSRREVDGLRSRQRQLSSDLDRPFAEIVGASTSMQEVYSIVNKVAATEANVLITGENGTGKELVARAIHRQSARAGEVFVRVDMGALSPTLVESELFGHRKGAFTDAREDRPGRFEVASGGTLFLDEIGNLPMDLQGKLLSALQERQITRVGANTTRDVDIRLICATNQDLTTMVDASGFRQDLLYRINTVEIRLPALRDRSGDIPLLAQHFLRVYAAKYRKNMAPIPPRTLHTLERYPWPGNVRELQHAVERAVILAGGELLQPDDFSLRDSSASEEALIIHSLDLEEVEKAVIVKALARHQGNVSHAARELGLTRTSLYRRLHRYEI